MFRTGRMLVPGCHIENFNKFNLLSFSKNTSVKEGYLFYNSSLRQPIPSENYYYHNESSTVDFVEVQIDVICNYNSI